MLKWKMMNLKKVVSTLAVAFIIASIGFAIDFQILKNNVDVLASDVIQIKSDLNRIEEVKDLQCEMALHIIEGDNDRILRICR